jgi:hypothetical protein
MTSIENLPEVIHIDGYFQTREIFVNGKQLRPEASQAISNHSPDGFNWGYGGSGPAQLALALLMKFMDVESSVRFYQLFKWNVIAKLPQSNFEVRLNLKYEINKIVNGII